MVTIGFTDAEGLGRRFFFLSALTKVEGARD